MSGEGEFVESRERRDALSILAKGPAKEACAAFDALPMRPDSSFLRAPETGLVMARGRVGGTGDAFNLGEMTVTRAVVRLASGEVGVGYVAGRDKRHAEVAAITDAMLQSTQWRASAMAGVVEPLLEGQTRRRQAASRKAAATRVDFFTMVRDRKA